MSHSEPEPDGLTQVSQLEELVACERELADQLVEAEERARRIVEEARTSAAEAEAKIEASLEDEAEELRAKIREDTRRRAREIEHDARERMERLSGITDVDVARLADSAFRGLMGQGANS